MICLNMAFLYMCEHVIICIHTCVSALITNVFAWSSSASELTPTWLCETLALTGPTYNNYRLPSWGAWHSQSMSPAMWPFFCFSESGSDLTWAILWVCSPKPSPVVLWSTLTYNNPMFWLWTHRLWLWYGFWLEKVLFRKQEWDGSIKCAKGREGEQCSRG